MAPLVFEEVQNFKTSWLHLLATIPLLFSLCLLVYHWYPFQTIPPIHFFLFVAASLLFLLWLRYLRLITRLTADTLVVRFRGLPFATRSLSLQTIKTAKAKTFSPLTDYGGWGVRYSLSGHGWCYTLSGREGLLIEFHHGKNLLIGSKKATEFEQKLALLVNPKIGL